jgi:CheY-like chemotaxis protein
MQQVYINLIDNARQSMAAVKDRQGRLLVQTSHENGTIRTAIVDNGEGMDQATQNRIFDPFFTTKKRGKGTGLGLSVSYGIVREHGGQISCRSRTGHGTTFVVELPILADRERSPGTVLAAGEGRAVKNVEVSSILVVDDEPMIVDLLLDILGDLGHRLDTAANGEEAWRKVCSNGYDLVITDIRMPRMSGIEFYRAVVADRPQMKGRVIFTTGDLHNRVVMDFLAMVNAQVLPKPLEAHLVEEAVVKALQENSVQ